MTHLRSQNGEEMDLSIIIVNWNTGRLLQQCIQSVYNTADGLSFEILVVDNASSDDSVQIVKSEFPRVRLIASTHNLGFSGAANLALASRDICFPSWSHRFASSSLHPPVAHPEILSPIGYLMLSWAKCG